MTLTLPGRVPSKKNSKRCRPWTAKEDAWLVAHYSNVGKLESARALDRTESAIRGRTSRLGLRSLFKFNAEANHRRGSAFRGKKRPGHSAFLRQYLKTHPVRLSKEQQLRLLAGFRKAVAEGRATYANFTRHKHTAESKAKISRSSRAKWKDPSYALNAPEYRQKLSDRASQLQQSRPWLNRFSRGKAAWATIGGKRCFFRSSWELLYARYLEFLKMKGEIIEWEYEPDTFWFEQIRRGVRSYKPDFKVTTRTRSEYHEVKGWMDPKSKTKIDRMARYYPEIKLIVVDNEAMKAIRKWDRLFPEE